MSSFRKEITKTLGRGAKVKFTRLTSIEKRLDSGIIRVNINPGEKGIVISTIPFTVSLCISELEVCWEANDHYSNYIERIEHEENYWAVKK